MKAERIGATAKDELKWALRIVYPSMPLTEGDKLNLLGHDLMLFAVGADVPVPVQSDDYLNDTLRSMKDMIESAIAHQRITQIPRPYSPELVWDADSKRYKMDERKESEFFETRVAGRLGELIR